MTNRIALIIGLLLVAALLVDAIFYGTQHLLFLSRKMLELIEWIAFWR